LTTASPPYRTRHRVSLDRLLAVIALATIAAAYIFGLTRSQTDVMTAFQQLLPSAQRFEPISDFVFAGYQGGQVIGYVTTGDAVGYGGPLELAVAVDPQGKVTDFVVIDHVETPDYLVRVKNDGLPDLLIGKSCQDPFRGGQDVDGISGATFTSHAIIAAMGEGCRQVAAGRLGLSVPSQASAHIQFGLPEIALILLFAVGFFGHRQKFRYTSCSASC
jgi:uncharacterized protein with FMN-binding domain